MADLPDQKTTQPTELKLATKVTEPKVSTPAVVGGALTSALAEARASEKSRKLVHVINAQASLVDLKAKLTKVASEFKGQPISETINKLIGEL